MSLPENYIEGITRVSSLVEHQYPFEGTNAQTRYRQWLKKKEISEQAYHDEACTVGTFVHLQMEKKIEKKRLDYSHPLYKKHKKEVQAGLKFMKEYKFTNMTTEIYTCDSYFRYQGSVDMIGTSEGKRILVDWKTWGIAKKRFNLPNKTTKPYSKLKKVALQMSLYAKALGNIDEIWVVWLHEDGYFVYKLPIVEDDILEELIDNYNHGNTEGELTDSEGETEESKTEESG